MWFAIWAPSHLHPYASPCRLCGLYGQAKWEDWCPALAAAASGVKAEDLEALDDLAAPMRLKLRGEHERRCRFVVVQRCESCTAFGERLVAVVVPSRARGMMSPRCREPATLSITAFAQRSRRSQFTGIGIQAPMPTTRKSCCSVRVVFSVRLTNTRYTGGGGGSDCGERSCEQHQAAIAQPQPKPPQSGQGEGSLSSTVYSV